jgi:hypothetical protein
MQRLWKILTIGAVFTGLGIAGAGTALADDDLDDLIRPPYQVSDVIAFDDDWEDDWFDDDWDD